MRFVVKLHESVTVTQAVCLHESASHGYAHTLSTVTACTCAAGLWRLGCGAAFAAIFAFIIIYYFCVGSTSARARTRTTPPLARARLRVVWCIPQALCHCRYAVLFLLAVLLLSASIFILGLVIPAPMS